jgi:hypothetical protein
LETLGVIPYQERKSRFVRGRYPENSSWAEDSVSIWDREPMRFSENFSQYDTAFRR